jgi:hypothetical protein
MIGTKSLAYLKYTHCAESVPFKLHGLDRSVPFKLHGLDRSVLYELHGLDRSVLFELHGLDDPDSMTTPSGINQLQAA